MNTDEAVTRALRLHAEIEKREPALSVEVKAALVVAAAMFQASDWIEDKLERIVQHLPE